MAITKTDFMRGMQCPKMLWLDKHKPSLKVIPPEVQARLDAGNDFGDRAMAMFGPYEEMTVYRPGTMIPDKKAMLEKTTEHMEKGTAVICEAAFSNYNNYCAVDILRRTATGYDIYEVKNAGELHDQFVRDAGFQHYILKRCRVPVEHVYIVLHGPDEDNPFLPVDVTARAKSLYSWINDNIWDLNRMQKEPDEIEVEPGDCCTKPYECWYYGYCHGKQENAVLRDEVQRRLREFCDYILHNRLDRNAAIEVQKQINNYCQENSVTTEERYIFISTGAGDSLEMLCSMPEE